jgi:predicted transcriptional regulator
MVAGIGKGEKGRSEAKGRAEGKSVVGGRGLTRLETEIMQVLWDREAGRETSRDAGRGASRDVGRDAGDGAGAAGLTVAEVQKGLKAELAYTTVQTMLNVLWRKKKVKRVQEGRAYRYEPLVSRERARGSAVHDLVSRMFGGSGEALLMAMLDTRQISAEELARVVEKVKKGSE